MFRKRIAAAALLFLISFALLFAAQNSTGFANWYSTHVYTVLVMLIGRFFGLFPFSVIEWLLYAAIIFWLAALIYSLVCHSKKCFCSFFVNLLLFAAILFSGYTLCCGVNYGRSSFSEAAEIESISYSVDDLLEVCEYLTEQINELAPSMMRSSDGVSILTVDVSKTARAAMQSLGESYEALAGYYPQPKGLKLSYILSVQQLTGVYSPFTIEANYNTAMPDYLLPFTACHELSHLRGFMQEEEANFIAFLACIQSESVEFQYSGYLNAWVYAGNQLYSASHDSYRALYASLSEGAAADLSANNQFWAQYEGKVSEVSNQVNDTYLKANGQSEGVMSYNRMVDLVMAYYLQ